MRVHVYEEVKCTVRGGKDGEKGKKREEERKSTTH